MPKIPTKKNWGRELQNENPLLVKQLDDAYTDIAIVINTTVKKYVSENSDPPASDQINRAFDIGDIWVRKDTNSAWIMTSRTSTENVTWTLIT